MEKNSIKRLVVAAACLAIALYLPFLTGQIPQYGNLLSPMHIPVLLCGFLCGPAYGAAVGFIAPLLRFVLFGMPPLFPTGIAMAVELAVYGLCTGFFYRMFPKKPAYVYVALILSMLLGRVAYGAASFAILTASGQAFVLSAFIASAFVKAWLGIIVHIALIPLLVFALRRAGLMANE
jgi:riboflavin transporter FmnP